MTYSIRTATDADAAAISEIYKHYVLNTIISFEDVPPTPSDIRSRMSAGDAYPWLVAEHDDDVVGYAYAAPHRTRAAYKWSVDAAVYLSHNHTGYGIGRSLYTELFARLRARGFVNVYAGVGLPNDASVGLHRTMGFRPVGTYKQVGYKFGQWHDVSWFQLHLLDAPAAPPEPKAFIEPA